MLKGAEPCWSRGRKRRVDVTTLRQLTACYSVPSLVSSSPDGRRQSENDCS